MTNYEELEQAVNAMNNIEEASFELQKTVYLGAIAQFLAKIADTLEQQSVIDKYKAESEGKE